VACAQALKPVGFVRRTVAGAAQVGRCAKRRAAICFPFNCAGMNTRHGHQQRPLYASQPYNRPTALPHRVMGKLEELADRVERLLLRHEELQRTNALLAREVAALTQERENLKARLTTARHRIDALLDRLPAEPVGPAEGNDAAPR
jgi:hypothetical protein